MGLLSIADLIDRELAEVDESPEALIDLKAALIDAARAIAHGQKELDKRLRVLLGTGTHLVAGCEVRVSDRSPTYSKWDRDALMRDVLDSRIFDDEGTLIDETPLDKVGAVFRLEPRSGAVRVRGLIVEDYCVIERAPSVQVIR